jgi:hypothetical protein
MVKYKILQIFHLKHHCVFYLLVPRLKQNHYGTDILVIAQNHSRLPYSIYMVGLIKNVVKARGGSPLTFTVY